METAYNTKYKYQQQMEQLGEGIIIFKKMFTLVGKQIYKKTGIGQIRTNNLEVCSTIHYTIHYTIRITMSLGRNKFKCSTDKSVIFSQ